MAPTFSTPPTTASATIPTVMASPTARRRCSAPTRTCSTPTPMVWAMANRREEEHCLHSEEGPGAGGFTLALINEAALLRRLLNSDNPSAGRMRRWLTHELLPSLHRSAGRSRNDVQGPEGPQTQTVKAVLRLAKEIIELTGVSEAEAFAAALMDLEANTAGQPDADLARATSRGRILIIATRENVTMLQEVQHVLAQRTV